MLGGLLGQGGFSSKCKSLTKLTKTRIDVIRRKRNASQRFLRKDLADLLSNGLDINAYGRAEGLLLEVILSSCYDFVERCCDVVLKHLSVMQKQRQCPEECRTAVASLMFAAARFSDLPELRDLRQMFSERFGESLYLFEDEEFKENLVSKASTLENKVRLMKDIALEFSIKWDSTAFEKRMNRPSLPPQEPPKAPRVFHLGDDRSKPSHAKDKVLKGEVNGLVFKERYEHNDGHGKSRIEKDTSFSKPGKSRIEKDTSFSKPGDGQTRHGLSVNRHNQPIIAREEPTVKKDSRDRSLRGRPEFVPERHTPAVLNAQTDPIQRRVPDPADAGPKMIYGRENDVPKIYTRDADLQAKPDLVTLHAKSSGKEKLADDNHHREQIAANYSNKDEAAHKPKSYKNMVIPPPYVKRYDKERVEKPDPRSSDVGLDLNGVIPKDVLPDDPVERHRIHHNEASVNPIPKPRSTRRRHSRSRSFHLEAAEFEEAATPLPRKSRSKRRDDPRKGLQVLFDDEHHQRDEEEKIIDKLLIHYSKKPSAYEPEKSRRKTKKHADREAGEPARSVSLPREKAGPSGPKVFARAATFQDRTDEARHVHPKLPDYDNLAAQFAALRGR